jgi:cytochrome c
MFFKKIAAAALTLIAAGAGAAPADAQDSASGAMMFKQRCAACHVSEAAKRSTIGPNLAGVFNRKSASRADFAYSPAMKKSQITWSKKNLDTFLSGPAKMVPGTRMPIAVPSPQDRSAIIAYLSKLGGTK